MKQKTIVYFNSGFFDTDITVVKELEKEYTVHWYVILSPTEPYKKDFFFDFIKGSNIQLHLTEFNCRKRSLKFCSIIHKCLKEIKQIRPSLIYTCHKDLFFPIFYRLFLSNIPLIIGIHDVKPHSSYRIPLPLKWAISLNIKLATEIVLFSRNQYHLFLHLYPKIKANYVGMSMKDFGSPTISCSPLKDKIKILFFGTLQKYKGSDLLIEAFEQLIDEGINNLELSFYGKPSDDDYGNECLKKIRHTQFYNLHLKFIENEDIPNIFNSHHFAIFPYRDATQSGPLMINARYGLPVIAPHTACFSDVYNNTNAIFYKDSNNIQELKEALKKVSQLTIEDYTKLKNSCNILKEKYSEASIANNYIKVFNRIIDEHNY